MPVWYSSVSNALKFYFTAMLDNSTLFVNVSAFSEAFLRTSALHTLLTVTHIIFIRNNLIIFDTSWNSPISLDVSQACWIPCGPQMVIEYVSWKIHPEVCLKRIRSLRVLIHLLSCILWRHGLWLHSWSMATTVMSAKMSFTNLYFSDRTTSVPTWCSSVSNVFYTIDGPYM